jgi:hypothetical protein
MEMIPSIGFGEVIVLVVVVLVVILGAGLLLRVFSGVSSKDQTKK